MAAVTQVQRMWRSSSIRMKASYPRAVPNDNVALLLLQIAIRGNIHLVTLAPTWQRRKAPATALLPSALPCWLTFGRSTTLWGALQPGQEPT